MLAQFFLSRAVSGKDEALTRLNRQIEELTNLLALERTQKGVDESKISALTATLDSARGSRSSSRTLRREAWSTQTPPVAASAAAVVLDQQKQISAQVRPG